MSKYAALAVAVVGLCLAPNQAANSAPPKSDEVYAAVRANDLAGLRTLVASPADANARDTERVWNHGADDLGHGSRQGPTAR